MTDIQTGIPTRTVSNVTGIAMATLQYWVKSDLITPSVRGRSGRRRTMLWSVDDLVALRVFADLRRQGCSLQGIRKAMKLITQQWGELIQSTVLTYQEGDLFCVMEAGDLASLLSRPGQQVLSISPIGQWKQEATVVAIDHAVPVQEPVERNRRAS